MFQMLFLLLVSCSTIPGAAVQKATVAPTGVNMEEMMSMICHAVGEVTGPLTRRMQALEFMMNDADEEIFEQDGAKGKGQKAERRKVENEERLTIQGETWERKSNQRRMRSADHSELGENGLKDEFRLTCFNLSCYGT